MNVKKNKTAVKTLPSGLDSIPLHQIAHAIRPSVYRRLVALGVQTVGELGRLPVEKYVNAPIRTAVSLPDFQRVKLLVQTQPEELVAAAAHSDMVFFPATAKFKPSFDWLEKALFFLLDRNAKNRRNDLSREVIIKRYGFNGGPRLALEAIGAPRHLTRERIRQVQRTTLEEIGRFLAGEYRRSTRCLLRPPLAEFFHEATACIAERDLTTKKELAARLSSQLDYDESRHAAIVAMLVDGLGMKEFAIGPQSIVFDTAQVEKLALKGSAAMIVRTLRRAGEPLSEKEIRAAWRASFGPMLTWEKTKQLLTMLDCVGKVRAGADTRYELLYSVKFDHLPSY